MDSLREKGNLSVAWEGFYVYMIYSLAVRAESKVQIIL